MTHGVSIVTGTWNRINLLQALVNSVRDSIPAGIRYEFIIVDGGSTDGTQAWCKQQSDVVLIEQGELTGAITAFTEGAKVAQYQYVILANDDLVFAYPDAIVKAIVHLEENTTCGAVAFADNRPVPPYYPDNRSWHVLKAPAVHKGARIDAPYAQVGMFRRWLGNQLNWWRGIDPRFANAKTYAGDNLLSSNIWQAGYSVDAVEGCKVNDLVIEDELRAINRSKQPELDSAAYYSLWNNPYGVQGAVIPDTPNPYQEDKRKLRILYLPIFEHNHTPEKGKTVQQMQKRGLRDALAKKGWVYEFDYQNSKNLYSELVHILQTFKPDILFSQFHGATTVTYDMLRNIRQMCPQMMTINWNGDTHRGNLTNPEMMKFLELIDLQLSVNNSVVDYYNSKGIPSAYWQCSFEPTVEPLPDVPSYDVIFQGSAYAPQRIEMGKMLREMLGDRVGIYGDYWEDAGIKSDGRTLYDFQQSTALYRNAKIAIGSNEFPDDYGFISNRVWEAMGAGGCLFLMQHVDGLEELTGLKSGIHYVKWNTFGDLETELDFYLKPEREKEWRQTIADEGTSYVRAFHSFDARVKQLFEELLPLARKKLQRWQGIRYTGMSKSQVGIMVNGQSVTIEPNEIKWVTSEEADYIIKTYQVFERVDNVAAHDVLAAAVNNG